VLYAEGITKGTLFMKTAQSKQTGFSRIEILLSVFLVTGIVAFGTVIANHQTSNQKVNITQSAAITPTSPVSNWGTYHDAGYAAASGISIKYPPEWKINIPGVKAIGTTKNPTAVINERDIFLPSSETPKEEWNTCAVNVSADACGAAPGDKTLSGSESTINGLAAYTATMQNSDGTYHVTVIRGNQSTSNGTPFVEFTTTSNDPAALNAYAAIMASAMFTN
jgi:hypothetical protein